MNADERRFVGRLSLQEKTVRIFTPPKKNTPFICVHLRLSAVPLFVSNP